MNSQIESVHLPLPWSEILERERRAASHAERQYLTNEFQTSVESHLSCVSLLLSAARQLLPNGYEKNLVRSAERGIREFRRDVQRRTECLPHHPVDDHGLVAALSEYAQQCTATFGIPTLFSSTGEDPGLPQNVQLIIFRVAQEAVTNALRHALASAISIELTLATDGAGLKVSDNGTGFDANRTEIGFGIKTMRQWAAEIGAEFTVVSRPGHGTQVVMIIAHSINQPKRRETALC
jgi:signal transduction histidine kinase